MSSPPATATIVTVGSQYRHCYCLQSPLPPPPFPAASSRHCLQPPPPPQPPVASVVERGGHAPRAVLGETCVSVTFSRVLGDLFCGGFGCCDCLTIIISQPNLFLSVPPTPGSRRACAGPMRARTLLCVQYVACQRGRARGYLLEYLLSAHTGHSSTAEKLRRKAG